MRFDVLLERFQVPATRLLQRPATRHPVPVPVRQMTLEVQQGKVRAAGQDIARHPVKGGALVNISPT